MSPIPSSLSLSSAAVAVLMLTFADAASGADDSFTLDAAADVGDAEDEAEEVKSTFTVGSESGASGT